MENTNYIGPIWTKTGLLIKPHNMSIDSLQKWRQKFDDIKMKYWTIANENKYSNSDISAAEAIPKKKSSLIFESL